MLRKESNVYNYARLTKIQNGSPAIQCLKWCISCHIALMYLVTFSLTSQVPSMTCRLHGSKLILNFLTSYWTSFSVLISFTPHDFDDIFIQDEMPAAAAEVITAPMYLLEIINSAWTGKTVIIHENNIFQERYPVSDRINLHCSLYH